MDSPSPQTTTSAASTVPSTPPEVGKALQLIVNKHGSPLGQYQRWRPSYHLQPRSGWVNDPCAPGYDPVTGLYHVSFQWNPNSPDWGDIAWGSATSSDMVHWTVQEVPTLSPDTAYDNKGVFTGCFINGRDSALTYAYTSVNALPIHHTLPHTAGSESLSLAKSFDHGKSWQKVSANPVLPCEPENLEVTGWRDPYVSRWPSMAKTLGYHPDNTLFGIISGGIRDVTPTTFLYAIDSDDFTRWEYIGPLVDFGLNLRPSAWSGDLGRNWEVTNFLTLQDELDPNVSRDFLVMGTEGCIEDETASDVSALLRPCRGQLWMSGTLGRKGTPSQPAADMSYGFGGHLDHGCLYAANSFFDPKIQKPVVWGWIPEDDLCDELRHAQGWSGMLSMPRELRMQTLQHVVGTCNSRLEDITSIEVEPDLYGSSTVRTLASEPLQRLVQHLRAGPGVRYSRTEDKMLNAEPDACGMPFDCLRSNEWELQCSFRVSRGCRTVGLQMDHGDRSSHSTILFFDPTLEKFFIHRPAFQGMSSGESGELVSNKSEQAPHTLFERRNPDSDNEELENLEIRAWRDNSVLEVFVNGRTAISTRLYAPDKTVGLRFFAEGDAGKPPTELVFAEVWDGIGLSAGKL